MCGRITQHRKKLAYLTEIGWDVDPFGNVFDDHEPNWNLPPGTEPWLMHRLGDEQPHIDAVKWGYRPSWAADKGIPIAINAREMCKQTFRSDAEWRDALSEANTTTLSGAVAGRRS